MTTFWIGTSGYNYKEWTGSFYPRDLSEPQQLRYYAERFPSVEITSTFYKVPSVRQLQGWVKEVPEHFAFTLKAPRHITHDQRLRDAAETVSDFCELAGSIKGRLGALLFQAPPFLRRDTPRLEDFLHQMPQGFRVTFEFRNPSWFTAEVYECLRRFDVALCIVDAPDRGVPWEHTATFGHLRLRQPDYDDGALSACARRIEELSRNWREAFIYFKQEAAGKGPILAARLRALLEGTPIPATAPS